MTEITEYEIIRFAYDGSNIDEIIGPFDDWHEANDWIENFLFTMRYTDKHGDLKDSFRIINRTKIVKENNE